MKITSVILYLSLLKVAIPVSASAQVFFDDFAEKKLNGNHWNVADRKWGENIKLGTHGGVVPDNVFLEDGHLVIRALGELYRGKIKGHGQNTKIGGVIYTKQKFASGSYEVRAKICPKPGALSAFWTYYFENDNYNHEIDFEFPGHNQSPFLPADSDHQWGLMSNWRGVSDSLHLTADKFFGNHTDGNYHLYRFEWHTGNDTQKPSIQWYYDNKLMHESSTHIPTHASEFWLGIWFPGWIKKADFDTDYMYIDWVKITPFKEANDENN